MAAALAKNEAVGRVLYPGLADHPDHELAGRQMDAHGGMVSFTVKGGAEAAERVHDRLRLFIRAGSLGGVESLVSIPARMASRARARSRGPLRTACVARCAVPVRPARVFPVGSGRPPG